MEIKQFVASLLEGLGREGNSICAIIFPFVFNNFHFTMTVLCPVLLKIKYDQESICFVTEEKCR